DGPGSRPVDRRGDCAFTPLVEHRVWITVTGLRLADAVTAVMPGEPANAGQADDTARSRIAAPDVHGHVPDIDEEIALDRATIDLDHVAELRDAEVHEVLHVLAVVIADIPAEALHNVCAEIGGEGFATELGMHPVRADQRDVLVADTRRLQASEDRGQDGADGGDRTVGIIEPHDDPPTAPRHP